MPIHEKGRIWSAKPSRMNATTPIAPGTELEHDAGTPFDAGGEAPDAVVLDAQMTDTLEPDDAGITDTGQKDAGPTNCFESDCPDDKTCVHKETGNRCTAPACR